jgi:hypothetical protein
VETSPGVFDFKSELEIIRIAAEYGLEVILVASTHACGSNVGDSFKVGIPKFYAKVRSPMVSAFGPTYPSPFSNILEQT